MFYNNIIVSLLVPLIALLFIWLIAERIRRENLEEQNIRLKTGHDKLKPSDYLLRPDEHKLYLELLGAFGSTYFVFSQVSLSALVKINEDQLDKYERRQTISKFYVDFVLCDKTTTKPRLVVELNGKSHTNIIVSEHDEFKQLALNSAGIPIYPCPVNNFGYSQDIENMKLIL